MFYFKSVCLIFFNHNRDIYFSTLIFPVKNSNRNHTTSPQSIKDSTKLIKNYEIPNIINSKLNSDSSKSLSDILIQIFKQLHIVSGVVYFSGAGFPYSEAVLFRGSGGNGITSLKGLFARCRSGSEITFEKCILKNNDGTTSKPVNRSILIQ